MHRRERRREADRAVWVIRHLRRRAVGIAQIHRERSPSHRALRRPACPVRVGQLRVRVGTGDDVVAWTYDAPTLARQYLGARSSDDRGHVTSRVRRRSAHPVGSSRDDSTQEHDRKTQRDPTQPTSSLAAPGLFEKKLQRPRRRGFSRLWLRLVSGLIIDDDVH